MFVANIVSCKTPLLSSFWSRDAIKEHSHVNIGPTNGLLPVGIKPSPVPILSYDLMMSCGTELRAISHMMTSSNGNNFRVTGHLCGEFPAQRPVMRSCDVFFDLRLNERLSKQSWGWWFETISRQLWRQCNAENVQDVYDE